jgi:solute carrier family 35 protein E3
MCSIYKKTIEFLERAKHWQIGVSIFLNVSFYYGIFALNKLMINEKHKVPKLKLAFLNYTTTFVALLVCNRVGCFKFVRMPILKKLPLAVFYCASAILTNYSYLHNPLDAYHLIKASSTILIILMSWILYSYRYSWKILSTVVYI